MNTLNIQHNEQQTKSVKSKTAAAFGFLRTMSSPLTPYKQLHRSLSDTSIAAGTAYRTIKNTLKSISPEARRAKLMENSNYSDAQKIKNDQQRFFYLAKANKLTKKKISQRIKIQQRVQLIYSVFALSMWTLALFYVSENIKRFDIWYAALAFLCVLGTSLVTVATIKAALQKTQLQDRDLMCLKRFSNHPKFYSKLLNPMS